MAIITTHTLTLSQMAQKILAEQGIKARVVKTTKSSNGDCVYGIEISEDRVFEVKQLLKNNKIDYMVSYPK
jgi:hypothetical protein